MGHELDSRFAAMSGAGRQAPSTAGLRERQASRNFPGGGSRNILLLSEDEGQRSLLRAYLQHVGFYVFSCADLQAALRMLSGTRTLQLILVDSHLLASSGRLLSACIAEHCPSLPVFAISGRSTNKGTLREIKHSAWEPDSEPFLLPDLLGWLQAYTASQPELESGIASAARGSREGGSRRVG